MELLAGAAVGYLVRKARRVGGRADVEVDRVLDEGMDALHDLVTTKMGGDRTLRRLEEGDPTEREQRQAADAIADAAEEDEEFAGRLTDLVRRLRDHEGGATHNLVADATVYGPVIQGRDFSGPITFGGREGEGDTAPAR